ncbi:MAG: acylphosphatase [Betaproteobacteria bacterium]
MIAKRVVVRGRVQGVGFRYAAVEAAQDAAVTGWVRNRRDATVEAHAQGDASTVDAFVAWCRRGPPAARVTGVDVADVPAEPGLAGFELRATV